MLKEQMKTKHLNVDTGKTTLALENPYRGLMEYLADEDGYSDWRVWRNRNRITAPSNSSRWSSNCQAGPSVTTT